MFRVMMVVVHLIYMFVFMLNSYLFSVFCFQKGFHHSAIILVIIFVHCGRFMCCFKGIISIFSYKMSHICFIFWAPFSALFCFINAHIWLCGRLFWHQGQQLERIVTHAHVNMSTAFLCIVETSDTTRTTFVYQDVSGVFSRFGYQVRMGRVSGQGASCIQSMVLQ